MFANRKRAWSASVSGSTESTVGGCCTASSAAGSMSASTSRSWMRRATIDAVAIWDTALSGSFGNRTVPGEDRSAGTLTTASTDSSASAAWAAASLSSSTTRTSWPSWPAVRAIADSSPAGAGPTTPITFGSSSPNSSVGTTNDPMTSSVVKATENTNPRLRPRSRISRLATSQMLRQRLMRRAPPGSRSVRASASRLP